MKKEASCIIQCEIHGQLWTSVDHQGQLSTGVHESPWSSKKVQKILSRDSFQNLKPFITNYLN